MRISRGICALVVAAGCASEADSDRSLDWVAPLAEDVVPAGDAIELAVETRHADAKIVEFFVDGEAVGTCDPAQPDEDCMRDAIWRWTVVFPAPGTHELAASFDTPDGPVTISRTVAVTAPGTGELEDDDLSIDLRGDQLAQDDGASPIEVAAAVTRGLLDPNRAAHRIFGGVAWRVNRQRVFTGGRAPTGAVSAITRCMNRYGASIRPWADHYKVSRGSVVATAMTESNCTNPAGSSDGLSSGPMQVTASTCSAITGLSRTTCRVRMHTRPDFSFQVGAKYMGSSFQRNQHHRDPPKIAAAYNAGSLHSTSTNHWHMRSTGNHIDRFVNAYNAYRKWEAAHGVPLLVAAPEALFEGDYAASAADLPTDAPEGAVVFVGNFAARDGSFYERVGDRWESSDTED